MATADPFAKERANLSAGMGDEAGNLSSALGLTSPTGKAAPVVRPPIATGKPPAPALQTPNQVGSYPGGSLPPVAAAPAAVPAPAFAAPKSPEELSGLIAAGRVSTDEEQIGRALQEAAIAKSKVDTDLALEDQRQKANNATREAGVAEDYAAKFKTTADKQKEMLNSSYGYFAPTRESAQDVAGIFSILTLATIGAGTQNKYSGMNALASLTGAMKGYKEGREDIYKKEMASYDKNVAEFSRRTDNSLKEMKLALEELSVDKDAAMARARAVAAADAGSMAALKIRSGDLEGGLKALQHQADAVRTLNQKKAEAERKHEEFKARQSETEYRDEQNVFFKRILANQSQQRISIQLGKQDKKTSDKENKALEKIGPALRGIAKFYPDGTAQSLAGASAKDKDIVQGSYHAIEMSENAADFIAKNPKAAGAMAAIKNFVKMDSIRSIQSQDLKQAADLKAEAIDDAIDKAVVANKITADDAALAKLLQKKLFALALADVKGSGQRGSIYLDKQFTRLYDQSSRPNTLIDIIKERAKENDSNLKIYGMGIKNHDSPEDFPLLLTPTTQQYMTERAPPKATDDEVKAYAKEHYNGDIAKAKADLKRKGFL
jgi:hypothetical protein